jgi:hypothetical protein
MAVGLCEFYACVAKSGYLGPGDQMQWKDQGGLTQHKLTALVLPTSIVYQLFKGFTQA